MKLPYRQHWLRDGVIPGRAVLLLLLCLSMIVTQACTITTTGAPRAIKAMESEALKGGATLTDSYGEFVAPLPGMTIASSVSHTFGQKPLSARPLAPLIFASAANAPRLRFVPYEGGCPVDMKIVALLQSKIDGMFERLGNTRNWRIFEVSMHFVPESASIKRDVTAVRLGRQISLRFYFGCGSGQPQRDIFHGVLTSLHEITHGMATLSGHDSGKSSARGVTDGDERLAEGGPSCLYEALKSGDGDAGLPSSLPASAYLAGDWELDGAEVWTPSDLCQVWMRTFSVPGAPGPLPSESQ